MKSIVIGGNFQLSDTTCGPMTFTVIDVTGAPTAGITIDSATKTMNIDSSIQPLGDRMLSITATLSSNPSISAQL